MTDETRGGTSSIEIELGQNRVKLEGSESFISGELGDVIQLVQDYQKAVGVERDGKVERERGEQATFEDLEETEQPSREETEDESGDTDEDPLKQVARSRNLPYDKLSRHFYVEDGEIHVQDPRNIKPKYALLGYGIIRKELKRETYLDNKATKEKLIDGEMVDIDRWGGKFLYRLRNEGLIKDDPNSAKSRNKPFKITPTGLDEFSAWLEDSNGE